MSFRIFLAPFSLSWSASMVTKRLICACFFALLQATALLRFLRTSCCYLAGLVWSLLLRSPLWGWSYLQVTKAYSFVLLRRASISFIPQAPFSGVIFNAIYPRTLWLLKSSPLDENDHPLSRKVTFCASPLWPPASQIFLFRRSRKDAQCWRQIHDRLG